MTNEIPKTKFVSRCDECLDWEHQHWLTENGGVACTSCGLCYHIDEKAVFLTREQYLEKYPKSVFAMDIRRNPTVNW